MTASSKTDQQFELGKLYVEKGDYKTALPKLKAAADSYLSERNYASYLKTLNMILRIYAEREMYDDVQATKEKLQDLVLKEGFELNAKTYYTLALCADYKNQGETALEYLQKSLAIALANDNKEDICYAINGLAITYHSLGKNNEALKEIYNLQVFFQFLNLTDVKISSLILNARILADLKKFDQAIDLLWQTYDLVREHKVMTMHIHLLYNLGRTYLMAGEKDLARLYLQLANKAVDPDNMIRVARAIKSLLNEVGGEANANYDLVFDVDGHTVTEKKLGRVDFKNQFILLDLLKLFVQNQGQVFSKEFLVEQVWKQNYDPSVHDNKIYVTIKRLRKMIEPDYDKPKYIFRAKNGYFMNKSAKVFIEAKGGEL